MQFSLRLLRYVVTVAELGSVTQASRKLRISQPAISGAIADAEAHLGTQIFIRHHARGVSTTAVGARFVHEARLLLRHAEDFERSAATLGTGIAGEITVGCFGTLATRYMPALLSEFAQRMPSITVQLEEGNQQEIVDGLVSGRMEIAIAYAYALPREITGEPLVELPPYLLVGADHPLAHQDEISLKQVANEPFILLDLPHSREYFMNLFSLCHVMPQIVYRSKSYELIRGLVGHGRGYTIHNALPGTSVTYDGSEVTARPIVEKLPPVRVTSLRLRDQTMRPAVKAFAEFLPGAFSPGGLF
ncbi:LysR family transcriptional regulator [Pseudohoeflea coraliihabitans]|uniref:LysR family transcriptional regulator n=1 Tax=Pseudohoeflea coraliihabitans TaxID=2860393 RepID=A0ABS6WK80_9HYPH|nr:LysR family transcriptional regulator [Pseudohoeflea sp. DP4N28-3]MBW3095847.1 LysR family transcriptional regulator [Pseudohoeflea sp. DP4N28-3]